jgi:acyl-CoA thioester hydrolase/thioesterase-3
MRYKRFESELSVRPDDIDMNNHVHTSKYFDYYLTARYDQMSRCYGVSMDKFVANGWTWYVRSCRMDFKRPVRLGETVIVRTWLETLERTGVAVGFQIIKKETGKLAVEGLVENTMVNIATGRPQTVPDWIVEQYTKHVE